MHQSIYATAFLLCSAVSLAFLSACGKTGDNTPRRDIECTVCDESRLPTELVEIINEKKEQPFRLTYASGAYMYVVVGYGTQNRDELSVVLEEFSLGGDAIYIDTKLASESQNAENNVLTYPYIAVKCEKYEYPVIFLDD